MIALFRYAVASMAHSQRYLAPVLLFLAALAVFTSNDDGPLVPAYAPTAGALFVCATWLTITLLNIDDPVNRSIVTVHARRPIRVLIAWIGVSLVSCLVLAALGLVFPLVTGKHVVTAAALTVGVEAELICALAGVAIGLVCSRLVIRRPGYALVVALGLVLIELLVHGLPPVNPLLRLMSGTGSPATMVVPAAVFLGVSVLLLVIGAGVTQFVANRRD